MHPLSGHKAEAHQKSATTTASPISYISLPSHSFFSDIVEETYNKNPSLCIYLRKLSFNSMCCLQSCEEHYLDRGVTDKKTGGLTTDKKTGYGPTGRATDVSRLLQGVVFCKGPRAGGQKPS